MLLGIGAWRAKTWPPRSTGPARATLTAPQQRGTTRSGSPVRRPGHGLIRLPTRADRYDQGLRETAATELLNSRLQVRVLPGAPAGHCRGGCALDGCGRGWAAGRRGRRPGRRRPAAWPSGGRVRVGGGRAGATGVAADPDRRRRPRPRLGRRRRRGGGVGGPAAAAATGRAGAAGGNDHLDRAQRPLAGAGRPRAGRGGAGGGPGAGPPARAHPGGARPERAGRRRAVPGRGRVGRGEHRRRRGRAAAVGRPCRTGGRGRLPGREHPRRHGGAQEPAVPALRLGRRPPRRPAHLARCAAGRGARLPAGARRRRRRAPRLADVATRRRRPPELQRRPHGGRLRRGARGAARRPQPLRRPRRGAPRVGRRPAARPPGRGAGRPPVAAGRRGGDGAGGDGAAVRGLLVCGTASDAGKSVVVAGICRWLVRQGVRVAPFKAQNMALNSAVTADGAEIGRAQVAQAAAARVAPEAAMNPILLKPTGEQTSQVVVMGRPLAEVDAGAYQRLKPRLRAVVLEALGDLRERFDVVVCEGAGSPAEINLRGGDLVNMGLARAAGLPVVVVGDIDRGGVFASLFGTLALLDAADQALVAGFLVNKFRGEEALLAPGLEQLSAATGRPVLGVLPWRQGLWLDAEDSLALEVRRDTSPPRGADPLLVAVVRLRWLSNFTDFDALAAEPGVVVRFTESPADVLGADLAVLPGTKATVEDLAWLRARRRLRDPPRPHARVRRSAGAGQRRRRPRLPKRRGGRHRLARHLRGRRVPARIPRLGRGRTRPGLAARRAAVRRAARAAA